jgi:hypothetical protein
MADNIELTADDLVKGMKGKSCTKNWDILVAYHEDKLNDLLGNSMKSFPMAS